MTVRVLIGSLEPLANGEALRQIHDADGELVDVAIVGPPKTACGDCGRELGAGENAFGIGGELYCEACGDRRLNPAVRFERAVGVACAIVFALVARKVRK